MRSGYAELFGDEYRVWSSDSPRNDAAADAVRFQHIHLCVETSPGLKGHGFAVADEPIRQVAVEVENADRGTAASGRPLAARTARTSSSGVNSDGESSSWWSKGHSGCDSMNPRLAKIQDGSSSPQNGARPRAVRSELIFNRSNTLRPEIHLCRSTMVGCVIEHGQQQFQAAHRSLIAVVGLRELRGR